MQTQRGVDKSVNKKMLKVAEQKWLNGPTCRHTRTEDLFLKGGRETNRVEENETEEKKKKKLVHDQYFGNSFTSLNILYKYCYILT